MKYVQRVGTLYKCTARVKSNSNQGDGKKSRSSSHPSKMIMIILREGHKRNEFLHNIFQQSKGASSLEVMNWRRLHLYSFNATRFDSSTAAPSSACLLLLGTWKIRKDDHSHQPPKAAIIMTFAILLIYFILVPPSDHSQTCFSILTLLLNRISLIPPIIQKKNLRRLDSR